jgi:hypothetical protein
LTSSRVALSLLIPNWSKKMRDVNLVPDSESPIEIFFPFNSERDEIFFETTM